MTLDVNIRVIKFFVTHSPNCNIDLKGFIKIRSMLAYSVLLDALYLGEN